MADMLPKAEKKKRTGWAREPGPTTGRKVPNGQETVEMTKEKPARRASPLYTRRGKDED